MLHTKHVFFNFIIDTFWQHSVAQLEERPLWVQEVAGSSPGHTNNSIVLLAFSLGVQCYEDKPRGFATLNRDLKYRCFTNTLKNQMALSKKFCYLFLSLRAQYGVIWHVPKGRCTTKRMKNEFRGCLYIVTTMLHATIYGKYTYINIIFSISLILATVTQTVGTTTAAATTTQGIWKLLFLVEYRSGL